jgi:hypothetical protein
LDGFLALALDWALDWDMDWALDWDMNDMEIEEKVPARHQLACQSQDRPYQTVVHIFMVGGNEPDAKMWLPASSRTVNILHMEVLLHTCQVMTAIYMLQQ